MRIRFTSVRRQSKLQNLYPFQGEPDISKVSFNSPNTMTLWNNIISKARRRLNIIDYYPQLNQMCEGAQEKSVCSKVVRGGEMIVECYDCRVDQSCIICYQCYKNGSHEGHKIIFRNAAQGCCDCGDPQAWKPAGFCRNHTGQAKDIQIEEPIITQFCAIMQDIFYIYYRLKIKKQQNDQMFNSSLFDTLMVIIEKGIKGIKLLSIAFQRCPSKTHLVNKQLQKQPFLHHFLTYKLMKDEMKQWQRIFINMFPYYAFKKQLTAAYMTCFVQIYAGDKIADSGQSLSCQILTSYRLVEDYIWTQGSLPLGFNLHTYVEQADDMGLYMMLVDLQRINSLQGDIPLKYWKFHIHYGINSLFSHYDLLKIKYSKYTSKHNQKQSESQNKSCMLANTSSNQNYMNSFLICNIGLIQNQYKFLRLMNQTIQIIKKDKQLLMLLIKKIYQLIVVDSGIHFIIFRPHDRLFSLALFHLIDGNFSLLQDQQFRQNFRKQLDINLQQWSDMIPNLIKRMFSTYMFFSHILTNENKGYHSSFYEYIYFYQMNDKFMSSIDILQLKMVILLSDQSHSILFNQIARINEMQPKQWNLKIFGVMMQEIGLLYTAKISQIYLTHQKPSESTREEDIYKEEIIKYLSKFLTNEGGSIGIDKIMQFSSSFLFNNKQILKVYLQYISDYDKEKKLFKLKEEAKDTDVFNYRDFQLRTKLKNYNHLSQNPKFTFQFITDYNKDIFLRIWSEQNLQSIKRIILNIYEKLMVSKERQNLVDLVSLVGKFIYLLSNAEAGENKINIIKQLLSIMNITPHIKKEIKFYDDLLNQIIIQGEDESEQKLSKRDLLLAKKKKKMEIIKKAQSQNMNLAKIIHEQELQKVNLQHQQQQNSQCCVICRNKQKSSDQVVYLVKMKIRDIQKLVGLGKGVKTLSFTTCYHIYHYSCIQNNSISNLNHRRVFKCPLCRSFGNIMFPVDPFINSEQSKTFVLECLQRITQILTKGKKYESADAIQELLKSFYHYVLLGQYEFNYLASKRRKLYQIILKLLSNTYFKEKIQLLEEKLKKSVINVRPKKMINRGSSRERIFNNHLRYRDGLQDDLEQQMQQFQFAELLQMQEEAQLAVQGQDIYRPYQFQFNRKAYQPPKQLKKVLKKSKILKTTDIFKYSLRKIILFLQGKILNQLNQKKSKIIEEDEQNNQVEVYDQEAYQTWPQVASNIVAIVDDLLNEENLLSTIGTSSEIKLESLPEIYNWDMTKNICEECKEIGINTMKCLMCPWKGCARCKSGNIIQHIQKMHGQTCPFMSINNAKCHLISEEQTVFVGYLYANEWGQKFNIKKQWKDYFLQKNIYEKVKLMLLRDE